MKPVHTATKTDTNLSKMWKSTLNIGAEQLHSDTEIATALTLQQTLTLERTVHTPLEVSSASELDDETNQNSHVIEDQRIAVLLRFFRAAFIGGKFCFQARIEANSLLFREFLSWLKQHQCMMPQKLRKPNNSLMFITDSYWSWRK